MCVCVGDSVSVQVITMIAYLPFQCVKRTSGYQRAKVVSKKSGLGTRWCDDNGGGGALNLAA